MWLSLAPSRSLPRKSKLSRRRMIGVLDRNRRIVSMMGVASRKLMALMLWRARLERRSAINLQILNAGRWRECRLRDRRVRLSLKVRSVIWIIWLRRRAVSDRGKSHRTHCARRKPIWIRTVFLIRIGRILDRTRVKWRRKAISLSGRYLALSKKSRLGQEPFSTAHWIKNQVIGMSTIRVRMSSVFQWTSFARKREAPLTRKVKRTI